VLVDLRAIFFLRIHRHEEAAPTTVEIESPHPDQRGCPTAFGGDDAANKAIKRMDTGLRIMIEPSDIFSAPEPFQQAESQADTQVLSERERTIKNEAIMKSSDVK